MAGNGEVSSESRQSEAIETYPAGMDAETPAGKATPSFKPDQEVRSELKLDLKGIHDDIEKTLIELEDLKSKVVPMADRKEFKAESLPPSATGLKHSSAASAPRPGTEAARSSVRSLEEQTWDNLEIFRARVASTRFRRRRNIFLALTAAALALIFGCFFFFQKMGVHLF